MSDYNDGIISEPCLRLDYGFGQEYASVELGDGTGYVRVTDDLRSEYHKMERWYDDELRAALDDNAKLRELVRDYLIFNSQPGCTYCFCYDECHESEEPCMAFERLVDRTNELGIEVPQ